MSKEKIMACVLGDSLFKVGDVTSLAHGWSSFRKIVSLSDIVNFKIIDMYYSYDNNSILPKFEAVVETRTGKVLNVDISDLVDVRNKEENRQELNKLGYDYGETGIYSKGYMLCSGNWENIRVGEEITSVI